MALWKPTRRELITTAPLALGGAILPGPLQATAAKPPLRFLVVGDWGRDGKAYQGWVAAQMAMRPGRFVVSTGDNFYLDGVSNWHDPQWDTSFERIYSPALDRWFAVLGNHDYGGNVEAQIARTNHSDRWCMPNHWFDHRCSDYGRSDVHLFFLDTIAWSGKEDWFWTLWGDWPKPSWQWEQLGWLEDKLRGSDAPFKIVFGHFGIFSIGPHGGKVAMRELDDVLRRYDVAAYVHGHDHCMFHITHRGMNYICSGAGSAMKSDYRGGNWPGCVIPGFCTPPRNPPDPDPTFPVWHTFLAKSDNPAIDLKGGFADFTIDDERLHFTFIDGLGQERYTSHIALPAHSRR